MMEQNKGFVPVDEAEIGLDRANINRHNQIKLVQQHPQQNPIEAAGPNAEENSHTVYGHHVRKSISEKRHGAALKLRKKLHISKPSDDPNPESEILANGSIEKSGSRLVNSPPSPDKPTLKDALHNPIDTVKSKLSDQGNHQVAANVAAKEIPHGKDVDLVKAQIAVENAKTDREKALATQTVEELIKERQNMFIRWTLDRHVTKVRVLPRDSFVRKSRADFAITNVKGEVQTDWDAYAHHLLIYFAQRYGGQYIGYGSDPPAPSKESIVPNIERLIVASAPLQEFNMTTRRVYRWENPTETAKYLLIYTLLWYFNLILPGILSAVLYLVVDRYFHGNTLEDLREDVKRTEDLQETAFTLTEYIEKKGDELWADELLQSLGQWLMVQLCDMANFFEVMRNFYEWRRPGRTLIILGLIVVAIFTTALVPNWLLIKTGTFSAGVTFFGLFPISSNFPEYRLLMSPAKRLFWNIPTHAEWAIKSIQAEGTRYQEENMRKPSTPPVEKIDSPFEAPLQTSPNSHDTHDHGHYNAHHNDSRGRLVISASSVRFETDRTGVVLFSVPFSQISNLEKVNRIISKNIPKLKADTGKDLKIVSKSGQKWILENVEQRDQAFSQIIGFSDTDWQVVW